jgi:hypothetical protein
VRDEQTHPHRPRLVVSHSTCPPLSSSPHANRFVIGPAVIKNTPRPPSSGPKHTPRPPSSPPWVGSRSPDDGWDQIHRWAGGWVLHQPSCSFGFDSQTRGTRENRAPPGVKVLGSSRVPCFPPTPREQLCNRYCSNKHTHLLGSSLSAKGSTCSAYLGQRTP